MSNIEKDKFEDTVWEEKDAFIDRIPRPIAMSTLR